MLPPKALKNNFLHTYRFYRAGERSALSPAVAAVKKFRDLAEARRFIQGFAVADSRWRHLLAEINYAPGLRTDSSYALRSRVAEALLRGKLRVYEVPRAQAQGSGTIVSAKGKDGFVYTLQPVEALLLQHDASIVPIANPADAEQSLLRVSSNPQELKPLLGNLAIPTTADMPDEDIIDHLITALVEKRLVLTSKRIPPPRTAQKEQAASESVEHKAPTLGPASEKTKTWFKLRFLDEIGKGIGGVEFAVHVDGQNKQISTGGDGSLRIDDVFDRFASAKFLDAAQIAEAIDARWEKPREGEQPNEASQTAFVFGSELSALSLKNEAEHFVVIQPPLGQLHIQLKDKTGRSCHANCEYSIEGPQNFSGTTDEQGFLHHKDVWAGDYTLKFSRKFFEGDDDEVVDEYTTHLTVLKANAGAAQVRMIGAVPIVEQACLKGMLFETNKSFLLPSALASLKNIRDVYEANSPAKLLIVGHTDTSGEPSVNTPLSEERALNTKAYLEDDVDVWLNMYSDGVAQKHRWGNHEDRLMIRSMLDFDARPPSQDAVKWFQETRKLKVDGIAGPQTRRQLITEYMALDGIKLEEHAELDIEILTHGAGEDFPLDDSGENLDSNAEDNKPDAMDRRVELFFFDKEFGIAPQPGSQDGKEYAKWRERITFKRNLVVASQLPRTFILELHDALYNADSCVLLPQADPASEADTAEEPRGALELFAGLFRHMETQGGKSLFICGHADANEKEAQTLSENRAALVESLLCGKRDNFVSLANKNSAETDYIQFLSWCANYFIFLPFDCDPEFAASPAAALKQFQLAYNTNKPQIGADNQSDLKADGVIGPRTWGAIFDVYQYAIRESLGKTRDEMEQAREKLLWLDSEKKSSGFGSEQTIAKIGDSNFRSKQNRRVEIHLFPTGDEPDEAIMAESPKTSELFSKASYNREFIKPYVPEQIASTTVRSMQLFGMIFDANRCFLLPYALPGIKKAVAMHKQNPLAKVLIVGHDGSDEVFNGVDIARCRAQIVGDYLKSNVDAWVRWFGADKPPHVRWGVREVQLMLSVLPEREQPHFIGTASGVQTPRTIEAVKAFQQANGLKVDGKAGPTTQRALIEAYMGLQDTTLAEDVKAVAHGCEGKFEDELGLRGIHPESRVLEIMFFDEAIVPRPRKSTSVDGDDWYFKWKDQTIEKEFFQFHGINIQILDKQKRPVPSSKVVIEGPTNQFGFTDEQGFIFFTGLQAGNYTVSAMRDRKVISTSSLTYPTAKVKHRK